LCYCGEVKTAREIDDVYLKYAEHLLLKCSQLILSKKTSISHAIVTITNTQNNVMTLTSQITTETIATSF